MKSHSTELSIEATHDPAIFAKCAAMMATSSPWTTMGISYEQCLLGFEGSWRETYVLLYQQKLAGFVVIQPLGSFKGYIQLICISEEFRGNGFGKHLLHFCEAKILETSPNVFICVSSFNTGALKLYQEFGFKLVGELNDFVKTGFTELLLRKTIGPMLSD